MEQISHSFWKEQARKVRSKASFKLKHSKWLTGVKTGAARIPKQMTKQTKWKQGLLLTYDFMKPIYKEEKLWNVLNLNQQITGGQLKHVMDLSVSRPSVAKCWALCTKCATCALQGEARAGHGRAVREATRAPGSTCWLTRRGAKVSTWPPGRPTWSWDPDPDPYSGTVGEGGMAWERLQDPLLTKQVTSPSIALRSITPLAWIRAHAANKLIGDIIPRNKKR